MYCDLLAVVVFCGDVYTPSSYSEDGCSLGAEVIAACLELVVYLTEAYSVLGAVCRSVRGS